MIRIDCPGRKSIPASELSDEVLEAIAAAKVPDGYEDLDRETE